MNNIKKVSAVMASLTLLTGCTSSTSQVSTNNSTSVTVKVESALYGSAYTNGKSTLKKEYGTNVTYGEDSKAVITLSAEDGSELDDTKINTDKVEVYVAEGDAYLPSYFTYTGDQLNGTWENGTYTLVLNEGDLEPSQTDYPVDNGGREWSALGSDGKGLYYINLGVSGLEYDGEEIDPFTIRVNVQIYGYDYTADAADMYRETTEVTNTFEELSDRPEVSDDAVFTWVGDGELPILCDALADNFYIDFPEDYDNTKLTAEDVTITLAGLYGDTLVLVPGEDYEVENFESETQIGLNFQYFAFAPVYSTMEIAVEDYKETFDIASVYVNPVQYGGGMDRENTVIAMELHGFDTYTAEDIDLGGTYTLSIMKDDTTSYYAEDEDGNAYLTDDDSLAMEFDATGEEDMNIQLIDNAIFYTEHFSPVKEMEVDGETVEFDVNYHGPQYNFSTELALLPGYTYYGNIIEHHKWAWMESIQLGWTAVEIQPMAGRYTWEVAKGSSETFTADIDDVIWSVVGASGENTRVSEDGVLTVDENETAASFALVTEDSEHNLGAITINVAEK